MTGQIGIIGLFEPPRYGVDLGTHEKMAALGELLNVGHNGQYVTFRPETEASAARSIVFDPRQADKFGCNFDYLFVDARSFDLFNDDENISPYMNMFCDIMRMKFDAMSRVSKKRMSPQIIFLTAKKGEKVQLENYVSATDTVSYGELTKFIETCGVGAFQSALCEVGGLSKAIRAFEEGPAPTLMIIDRDKGFLGDTALSLSKLHPDQNRVFININGNAEPFEMTGAELCIQCVSSWTGFISSLTSQSPDVVYMGRIWDENLREHELPSEICINNRLSVRKKSKENFLNSLDRKLAPPYIVKIGGSARDCDDKIITIKREHFECLAADNPISLVWQLAKNVVSQNDRHALESHNNDPRHLRFFNMCNPVHPRHFPAVFGPLWRLQALGQK